MNTGGIKKNNLVRVSILILIKKIILFDLFETRIFEIVDALLTLEQKLKLETISFQSDSRFLLYRVLLHCMAVFSNRNPFSSK